MLETYFQLYCPDRRALPDDFCLAAFIEIADLKYPHMCLCISAVLCIAAC
jgi:hypothetical protein